MPKYSAEIVKPSALPDAQKQAWAKFRQSNSDLYSPYFAFEYTQMLSTIRDDVHVLVVMGGNDPLAFLPFQGDMKASGKIGFCQKYWRAYDRLSGHYLRT